MIWPWKKEWNQNDKGCEKLKAETKSQILFPNFYGWIHGIIYNFIDPDTISITALYVEANLTSDTVRHSEAFSISNTSYWKQLEIYMCV